ncbi:hypothetical protein OCK74_03005 [Chitinophagaceae bacterium LB-8]|uniref:Uncharacterized protein n=1 Tax=Paraflavisolibacter caeni TaxID=2982496 RepID=A0A9X3BGS3_9BACT|nr:hypothetical protein [Paraflavisolibacter caeni]MCU7548063.1 hypothetical protein [Paraflavisolibacter caeni]
MEEELRPEEVLLEVELLEDELPGIFPFPVEEPLMFEADVLLPLDEALLLEEPALPAIVLLSFEEAPLADEPLELRPDVEEVFDVMFLLVLPLFDDAKDLVPSFELVPLLVDSLLVLFSLGVPPVVRLVPVLLFEVVVRPLDAAERPPEVELEVRPLELPERALELPERPIEELLELDVFVDCD